MILSLGLSLWSLDVLYLCAVYLWHGNDILTMLCTHEKYLTSGDQGQFFFLLRFLLGILVVAFNP